MHDKQENMIDLTGPLSSPLFSSYKVHKYPHGLQYLKAILNHALSNDNII